MPLWLLAVPRRLTCNGQRAPKKLKARTAINIVETTKTPCSLILVPSGSVAEPPTTQWLGVGRSFTKNLKNNQWQTHGHVCHPARHLESKSTLSWTWQWQNFANNTSTWSDCATGPGKRGSSCLAWCCWSKRFQKTHSYLWIMKCVFLRTFAR